MSVSRPVLEKLPSAESPTQQPGPCAGLGHSREPDQGPCTPRLTRSFTPATAQREAPRVGVSYPPPELLLPRATLQRLRALRGDGHSGSPGAPSQSSRKRQRCPCPSGRATPNWLPGHLPSRLSSQCPTAPLHLHHPLLCSPDL